MSRIRIRVRITIERFYYYVHVRIPIFFFNGVILAYILNHIVVVFTFYFHTFLCATDFLRSSVYLYIFIIKKKKKKLSGITSQRILTLLFEILSKNFFPLFPLYPSFVEWKIFFRSTTLLVFFSLLSTFVIELK